MKEKEGVNTHTYAHNIYIYIGETPSAFFKQHQHKEERRTIYTKLYQTEREREKSGYFEEKNLVELVKKRKKREGENKRKRDIALFSVYSIEVTVIQSRRRRRRRKKRKTTALVD